MKIKILASGSKGNCAYIESNDSKILIDAGISYKMIKNILLKSNINISEINGIFLTHSHSDHILGLASLVKKEKIKVYIKEKLFNEINKYIPEESIVIIEDNEYLYRDIKISFLKMSHDVPCYSFIISSNNKNIFYVTDTGYINRKYKEIIKNMDMYLIEANHNESMLMDGPYPLMLKQRVVSDSGHMSNKYAGKVLKEVVGDKTKHIILLHISENNNTEELALSEVKEELEKILFNGEIVTANQYKDMEIIEL